MPAKLKALKYSLMEVLHPNHLLAYYPVPNKVLLYILCEQLKLVANTIKEDFFTVKFGAQDMSMIYNYFWMHHQSILIAMESYIKSTVKDVHIDKDALNGKEFKKVVNQYITNSCAKVLEMHINAHTGPSLIMLPTMASKPSTEELTMQQSMLLDIIHSLFLRTAYPWLEAAKMKKVETLITKLAEVYKSNRPREVLLGTTSAWQARMFLQTQLDIPMKAKTLGTWTWADGINKQPKSNAEKPFH
ncbi:hypothetical protein OG21DRAFT_1525490 [Imleria badia]|nr:hypothetical protein OG21DRAFT_1525490 [Imleria badia]